MCFSLVSESSHTLRKAQNPIAGNGAGFPLCAEDLPVYWAIVRMSPNYVVELTGIEPVTPCLQSRCSPS